MQTFLGLPDVPIMHNEDVQEHSDFGKQDEEGAAGDCWYFLEQQSVYVAFVTLTHAICCYTSGTWQQAIACIPLVPTFD